MTLLPCSTRISANDIIFDQCLYCYKEKQTWPYKTELLQTTVDLQPLYQQLCSSVADFIFPLYCKREEDRP